MAGAQKLTNSLTFVPSFELKLPPLTSDGAGSCSRSKNDYENIVRGIARSATVNTLVADFRAPRPSSASQEWTITQPTGPDWSNLANHLDPRITEEGRFALTEIDNLQLNAMEWRTRDWARGSSKAVSAGNVR